MSLPRKRHKHQNELAKQNPKKQELKIRKGRKLFDSLDQMTLWRTHTDHWLSRSSFPEEDNEDWTTNTKGTSGQPLNTRLSVKSILWKDFTVCLQTREVTDVKFYNRYFAVIYLIKCLFRRSWEEAHNCDYQSLTGLSQNILPNNSM